MSKHKTITNIKTKTNYNKHKTPKQTKKIFNGLKLNANFFNDILSSETNPIKMLVASVNKAFTVVKTPYRGVLNMPVYYYRINYMDKFPGKLEFKTSTTFGNLKSVTDFIRGMMRMNNQSIITVLQKFKATCSCSDDIVCNCNCFAENPTVYEIFGDVTRPPPTVKQIEYQLYIDWSSFIYRIGHVQRLDEALSHMPRFQFEVNLEIA